MAPRGQSTVEMLDVTQITFSQTRIGDLISLVNDALAKVSMGLVLIRGSVLDRVAQN